MKSFKRLLSRLAKVRLPIPLPIPGVGCGVLGMVCARRTPALGEIASRLLEKLEYRGYDSTGLCIQDSDGSITLKKAVGAPSRVVRDLELETHAGRLFCGQVRWATFGMVDDVNAQPHLVACKERIYGAHNGNITNCDFLKEELRLEGHLVLSDNDGEMLVHTVEHFFFLNLEAGESARRAEPDFRRDCMIRAIRSAGKKIRGSYAAVVVDPVTEEMFALKCGSSLYVGKGVDPSGGEFILASSDLSAVLSRTRILIPLSEGEFIHFTAGGWTVHSMADPSVAEHRPPKRSKLRNRDTLLHPPFQFFMEQEIASQADAARELLGIFYPSQAGRADLFGALDANRELAFEVRQAFRQCTFETETPAVLDRVKAVLESEEFQRLRTAVDEGGALSRSIRRPGEARLFSSAEEGFLQEVHRLTGGGWRESLVLVDALFLFKHQYSLARWAERFAAKMEEHRTGRIHVVACGSSYNAARIGAMILNRVAGLAVACHLPGEFRTEALDSVQEGDLFIGISQSGETKDLVDICNALAERSRKIARLMIVNNVNSTLAQEKCDFYLPILCGPEIAVPATKSFTNQVILLYGLALKCLEARGQLDERYRRARRLFQQVPRLIEETMKAVRLPVRELAGEIFLAPSLHVLSTGNVGLAREAALKVREVVLNHAEGMEASEFKHGPNTILGKNFTFGLRELQQGISRFRELVVGALDGLPADGDGPASFAALTEAFEEQAVKGSRPFHLDDAEEGVFDRTAGQDFYGHLFTDYPLVFLTPPTERDVALTISQINTHKIRGASIFVIAEEDAELRQACERAPTDASDYRSAFIVLPRTGSELVYPIAAMTALQMLALEMSVQKMKFLNRLKIPMHGVHPDVPKNVSKSITVD
ncbi:MAG: SIS domain-containing protein [Acidobacteria bacterium]|nr:SIS domain-containing protein [Acidobacteriota bacterium]